MSEMRKYLDAVQLNENQEQEQPQITEVYASSLDELINELQKLRGQYGGSLLVMSRDSGGNLLEYGGGEIRRVSIYGGNDNALILDNSNSY